MSLQDALRAYEALSRADQTILRHYITHGVKPIAPVRLTVVDGEEEGDERVVLPDGTEVGLEGDLIELDMSSRWNYGEIDVANRSIVVVQGDGDYETVTFGLARAGGVIPVAVDPYEWDVIWD